MSELRTEDGELYAGVHPVIKGWESFTGWYWFAVEKVGERRVALSNGSIVSDTIWFGFIQGNFEEWGNFSEAEIRSLGNLAWPLKPQDLPYSGRR